MIAKGPTEAELNLIVYGPDGKSIWSGPIMAVPRVGEIVMITDASDSAWQVGGEVTKVIWMLRDLAGGQIVAIYLDQVVRPTS